MVDKEKIKKRMRKFGITQALLAEKLGKSRKTVNKMLGSKKNLSDTEIKELTEILQLTSIDEIKELFFK